MTNRDREYAMKNFLVSVFLLFFAAAGCSPYFTRHYEDSFFAVAGDKKFSVEIVTGKRELKLDANAVGIIVHNGNDEDVEKADVAATAVIKENDREADVAYAVTEMGRGLYVAESLDLGQKGLSQLKVTIKKHGVSDIAVFDFSEKISPAAGKNTDRVRGK
ncbi:MAG: hypothetical protein OEW04_08795 [Nitrospirota bacterium]|nr:hypothetical protein [Nitrospirota bacterium]